MSTQAKIDTWGRVIDFLGALWLKAMQADEEAGENLPRELADVLLEVTRAFGKAAEVVGKYRTRA